MRIKSVTITGMHHISSKTFNFENINYLYGPNGAGKSTVLNAVQLAILGYIPGTAKQSAAIFQHASLPEMEIQVTFDDGRFIKRRWTAKGKSVMSTVLGSFNEESIKDIIGDLELPIFNFNELVNMTANKLKDWFINFLPAASMDLNWKQELENSLNGIQIMDPAILEDALKDLQSDDGRTVLEKIQAFNAQMKANQSFMKTEIQRNESTVQSLIYYDDESLQGDAEFLNSETQTLMSRIQELTNEKEQLIRAQQIVASNEKIQAQIAALSTNSEIDVSALTDRQTNLNESITELTASVTEEESIYASKIAEQASINAEIRSKMQIINGGSICPYTKSKCESITTMTKDLQVEVDELKKSLSELSSESTNLKNSIDSKKQRIAEYRRELMQISQSISYATTSANSMKQMKDMLQPETNMSRFAELSFYASEIAKLNTQISKIEANQRYNSLIDNLTAEKYKLENSAEVYKCWAKLTDPNGLQTRIMNAPFRSLADEMNKYLHIMFSEDVSCNFNLEQKANSFSLGIKRSERYIPYDLLSSGEKTMFALALMLCIIDKSTSDLKILIVDDMLDHLDNNRANEVFKSLQNVQGIQIILAGVKESENANAYTIKIE